MEPAKSLEGFLRLEVVALTIDVVLALLMNDEPKPDPPPLGGAGLPLQARGAG